MMDITKLFSLQGRVALITGGSKNLGKHIAEGFIAQGAKVYISSRKADACVNPASCAQGHTEWSPTIAA